MFAAESAKDWTKMVARIRRLEALQKRVKKLESK
jgi:UDP-3-O-[3-hydroxymyristoyl] glucosamine N-acyltransferase